MQDFLENGNLNPGIHEYSFNEVEKQFVIDFPSSETRKNIYQNFCIWLKKLVEIKSPRYIWLDGSFLTKKVNPNDLDLVVFYRPEDITSEELAVKLNHLIHTDSANYLCDAYICLSLSHLEEFQKEQFGQTKIMETYWKGQFSFDRNRNPKGIVEIKEDEIKKFRGGVYNDDAKRLDR